MIIKDEGVIMWGYHYGESSMLLDVYTREHGFITGLAFRILRPVNLYFAPLHYMVPAEMVIYLKNHAERKGKIREISYKYSELLLSGPHSYYLFVSGFILRKILSKVAPSSELYDYIVDWLRGCPVGRGRTAEWQVAMARFIEDFLVIEGVASTRGLTIEQIENIARDSLNIDIKMSELFTMMSYVE